VREEVASRMDELQRAMASLEEAEAALVASGQSVNADGGSSSDSSSEGGERSSTAAGAAALDAYVLAQAAYEAAGGPTAEKRIAGVLKGLG